MSRNHLRVSAQANNERHESEIIREIMNKAHPDYARSEATTEVMAMPPAITPAPVKKGTPKGEGYYKQRIRQYQQDEADLTKQVHNLMEDKDAQIDALSRQRESIAELCGQVATLKKLIDRRGDEHHAEVRRGIVEIEALKALVKLYI